MRLTRLGWGCLAMAGLALMTAGATGNNLLYLLYSALIAAMVVSAAAGRLNLAGLSAEAEPPGQLFRGAAFPLRINLINGGRRAACQIEAVLGASRASAPLVAARGRAAVELAARAEHRGFNRLEGLRVESRFPWGLISHRRALAPVDVLALPRLHEVHGASEVRADARSSGRPTLRKGAGEDLYGIRAYDPSDDARKINWKLSARSGRPLVNEYCEARDSKITVTVPASRGADAERRIEDAASACRYYVDSGAEVRLVTPESEAGYGKGLLHLDRLLKALALLGEGREARSCAPEAAALAESLPCDSTALRRLTWLGGCLIYAAIYLIDDVNAKSWSLFLPILPLGWFVQERGKRFLPEAAWTVLSLLALAYTAGYEWRMAGVIVADTHLVMYLLANRLLNVFAPREMRLVFLIYLLAFSLVSGLTISPWYFGFFLGYVVFCAAWLSLAAGAAWPQRRSWGPAAAGWLAACLVLCVAVFAATPRVERYRPISPFLGALNKLQARSSAVTGFSENIALGWFGELKRSSARVMRVRPLGTRQGPTPASGRPGPLRVRGAAYDVFDGLTWKKELVDFEFRRGGRGTSSTGGRAWAARREGSLRLTAPPAAAAASPAHEITVFPLGLSVLFTVGSPWFIEGINDTAYFDYTDSLYVATPYLNGLRYRVYSALGPAGARVGLAEMTPRLKARFLAAFPDPGGRIAELSARAVGPAKSDEQKARAIEEFLRRRYSYSMYSDSRGVSLPGFLFGVKKGNCEYFATAGVMLMRQAGIPARLVTGFLSEDWNEFGGFYDVRQRSAHAWVEAFLDGKGWTVFDPTPAQSAFSASADALSRRLERWMDAFQGEWYRSVIGYDQYAQTNTFHRIGVAFSFSGLYSALRDAAIAAGLAFAVWLAGALFLRALRRAAAERALGPYGRAERLLARAGLPRPAHLTPREYAVWVGGRRPELAALALLAEFHYRQRYSGLALSAPEQAQAEGLLRSLGGRL